MKSRKQGFTLIELVVVIMILGILAAVAAPKLFNTSGNATDNGIRHTLSIVRDAIELYSAENGGALPGADGLEATFKTDLTPYIRGIFPKCTAGALNSNVKMTVIAAPIAGVAAPVEGWHYCNQTGEFIVNYNAATKVDATVNYDQL